MSFVSDLREELVAAAEREEARRLPRVQRPSPRLVLALAATAAMALAIVLAAAALNTRPVDDGERPAVTPTPDVRPLFGGTMTPDVRYQTTEFVPTLSFVVGDNQWHASITDRPDVVLLDHGQGTFEPGGERWPPGALSFGYIREVYDPNVRGLRASLTTAPRDLHAWMRAHPDLRVGPAEPVTVAGVPGEQFSVEVRFDRPTHPDPDCRRRWQLTCTALMPGSAPQNGALMQITILRTEPDPLVIWIDHHTRAGMSEMLEASAPVLESLRIG
jgi:hypothetical protein